METSFLNFVIRRKQRGRALNRKTFLTATILPCINTEARQHFFRDEYRPNGYGRTGVKTFGFLFVFAVTGLAQSSLTASKER